MKRLLNIVLIATVAVLALEGRGEDMLTEKATFAAGCFWGVESAFRTIDGVIDAPSGYIGGQTENPTYKEVCSGHTGHAEAVEITFDPAIVSYAKLVELFWRVHNPTQVNRQGPDFGTQYRSAIFFHTLEQKVAAEKSKIALEASGKYKKPIATEIVPAAKFYRAEEYHQRYFEKTGRPACHFFQ
jgi:peptide-methionine (S)-S-oxide reductase